MKNLKLATSYGLVTVVRTNRGLEYNVPAGMSGEKLQQVKAENAEAIAAFKIGDIKGCIADLQQGDLFYFAGQKKGKRAVYKVARISPDEFVDVHKSNEKAGDKYLRLSRFGDERVVYIEMPEQKLPEVKIPKVKNILALVSVICTNASPYQTDVRKTKRSAKRNVSLIFDTGRYLTSKFGDTFAITATKPKKGTFKNLIVFNYDCRTLLSYFYYSIGQGTIKFCKAGFDKYFKSHPDKLYIYNLKRKDFKK